jgi:hypothetical protein
MFSLTLDRENNSRQNWLVNTGSLSLTIKLGIPCSLTMLSKKTRGADVSVYGWPKGKK